MIPRVFHQIWLGDAPPHPLFVKWAASWGILHRGWEFRDWTQPALEALGLHDQSMLDACCHNAQRANVWRLLLLRKFGGVYIDTDMEPLKNIEPLLEGHAAVASPFWAGTGVNNAFMASEPNHPWIVECCERLRERDPSETLSMGSRHVTSCLANHPSVHVLPKKAVYQNAAWHDGLDRLRPPGHPFYRDIYAIHHFSYRWYPTGFKRDGATETGR